MKSILVDLYVDFYKTYQIPTHITKILNENFTEKDSMYYTLGCVMDLTNTTTLEFLQDISENRYVSEIRIVPLEE